MSRNSQSSQELREWASLVSLLTLLLFAVKERKRGGSKDFKTKLKDSCLKMLMCGDGTEKKASMERRKVSMTSLLTITCVGEDYILCKCSWGILLKLFFLYRSIGGK